MKKMMKWMVAAVCLLGAVTTYAQSAADKLLGVYQAEEEGRISKVRFTKCDDGTYQGQIIWLSEPNNPDGTRKMDVKNPDPKKRNTPSDQVVIVYGVRYNAEDECWEGGKVYKPINGKIYNVELSFEDDKKLRVKGSVAFISLSRYWKKIE